MKHVISTVLVLLAGIVSSARAQDCTNVLKYAQMESSSSNYTFVYHNSKYTFSDSSSSSLNLSVPEVGKLGFSDNAATAISNAVVDLREDKRSQMFRDLSSQATAIYKACVEAQSDHTSLTYTATMSSVRPDDFTLEIAYSNAFRGKFQPMADIAVDATPFFENAKCHDENGVNIPSGKEFSVEPHGPPKVLQCVRWDAGAASVKLFSKDLDPTPKGGVTIPEVAPFLKVSVAESTENVVRPAADGSGHYLQGKALVPGGGQYAITVQGPKGAKIDDLQFFVRRAGKNGPATAIDTARPPPKDKGLVPKWDGGIRGDRLIVVATASTGSGRADDVMVAEHDVQIIPDDITYPNFHLDGATYTFETTYWPDRSLGRARNDWPQ